LADPHAVDPYEVARKGLKAIRLPYGLADDPARQKWPAALAFATDRQFPGGKTREVPRIALEALSDGWRLSVSDYNLSMKGIVEFRHLEELFSAWEDLQLGRRGKWVEIKSGEGYKRRKAEEERQLASRPDEMYTLAKGGGDPRRQVR
jgi:hypothetical protein